MFSDRSSIIYVLLDGVGDLPSDHVGGLTPLQAASTPALDSLAKRGRMGEVITVGYDIAPQSDIAVFNMLGYDFKKQVYPGRGVVELLGSGVDFRDGDLALRGNFATIDEGGRIIDRRAGRDIEQHEACSICQSLSSKIRIEDPDVDIVIKPTVGHRLVVRFRHKKMRLSDNISNTDPAYDKVFGIGVARTSSYTDLVERSQPQDSTREANVSAFLVNDFSSKAINLLADDPINIERQKNGKKSMNCVLLRDAGNSIPSLEPIEMKYRMKVAGIVDMPVEIGIANILKMEILQSGRVDDYRWKAAQISSGIARFGLIYAHIKGPDEFGHDGDAMGKMKNIEEIDRLFFDSILQESKSDNVHVVISADHSTPCIKRAHSADPVPLLVSGYNIRTDGSLRFTEEFAAKGALGRIFGSKVISVAMQEIYGQAQTK
ncbi:MAG: alkaline phosphatase family protein [Thermoproteota archaeon]|nr:alkaline phosphatase family protein [Thermoproteota archaeon]